MPKTLYDIHEGKRVLIDESIINTDVGTKSIIFLLMASELPKYPSVLHIQKVVLSQNKEYIPLKGGIMIDVSLLGEVKQVVDKLYLSAIEKGLL